MLIKTHLAFSVLGILLLIPLVEHKTIFILSVIFATYLPDVDSRYSSFGKRSIARILQFFTTHRGLIHSFSFLLVITLLLVFFLPIFALGIFVGFGLHLFADSLTPDGIRPFYPSKRVSSGFIETGSKKEFILFLCLIAVNFFLVLNLFF